MRVYLNPDTLRRPIGTVLFFLTREWTNSISYFPNRPKQSVGAGIRVYA